MSESYSVIAKLSAVDQNFSSVFGKAMGTTRSLGDMIKSTALGMGAFKIASSAVGQLTSHLDSAISRYDTMNNFPKIMGNLGISAKDSQSAIDTLNDKLTGLPTTLDAAASGVTNFTSKNNDVKKSTGYYLALNNAIIAGGKSTDIQSTAMEQLSQSYAKGKMDMMEWRSLQTAMPAQLNQVAKAMGTTSDALGDGLRDGSISMDQFMDTLVQLNENGVDGFASFEEQARAATDGIETAMTNINTAVTRGMTGCIGAVDSLLSSNGLPTLGQMANRVGYDISATFNRIQAAIGRVDLAGIIKTAIPYYKAFHGTIEKVKSSFGKAFGAIASSIGKFLSNAKTIAVITKIINGIGTALSVVADVVSKHAGVVTGAIAGIVVGFKALKTGFGILNFVKSFNPFSAFSSNAEKALGDTGKNIKKSKGMLSQLLSGLANIVKQSFDGVAKTIKATGPAISTATKGIGSGLNSAFKGIGAALKIANPVAILALGAAIGIVVAAFTLLATQGQGVATIIESVGSAIGTVVTAIGGILIGMLNAVIAAAPQLAVLIQAMGVAFATAAPFVTALGTAISAVVLAIGTAVSQIATALTPIVEIIANVFTSIAQIIGDTIVRITQAIAPFIPVIADAFTQCTQIVSNAIVAIVSALAPYMPNIQAMVEATSAGIQAICSAFSTLVGQIAPIISSITTLVQQLGDTISQIFSSLCDVISTAGSAIAETVSSIGESISSVIDSISGGLTSVLQGVADVIGSVGQAAKDAGTGFNMAANGIRTITSLSIADMAASLKTVADGLTAIGASSSGLQTAGNGMRALVTAIATANGSIVGLNNALTQLSGIASAVSTSVQTISSAFAGFTLPVIDASPMLGAFTAITAAALAMAASLAVAGTQAGTAFCTALQAGISRAPQIATNAINQTRTAIQSGMSQVPTIASQTMNQFCSALQSGSSRATSIARSMASSINSSLRSASSGAYSSGAQIGAGLANGMASQLGRVRSIASQLAAAAEQAIRAQAQIHSPSRVTNKLGTYFGQGFVNGIKGMISDAKAAVSDLVMVPDIAAPALDLSYAGAYSGGLNAEEYSYKANCTYVIETHVDMDGKEIAKGTAEYTQEELNKMEKRNNRKNGNR